MELVEGSDVTSVILGKIVMHDLPKAAIISVVFHLRREGSLHVTCKEENSQRTESITVEIHS